MASLETLIFDIIARDKQASAAFDRFRRSVDGTTGSVDKNTQALDKNTQAQKSALGGAVGLGVAFSAMVSPIAAAGAGAVAFGALAAPSVVKVSKALTGPGGLNAAWTTLDNRQKNMALGVQALGKRYSELSTALEPRTAQVFATALGLINNALGPAALLAGNAGSALEGFLVQFSHQSGLNQFITFMAHEAGPAIALLGTDITNITHAVLSLLQSWGGLGLAELKAVTTVITGITDSLTWLSVHAPGLTAAGIAVGGVAVALSKFGLLAGTLRLTGLSMAASQIALITTEVKGLTLAERGFAASEAAVNAVTPFGWVLLGAAALGGLVYLMTRASNAEKALIDTTLKQTHAQGFNTAGYAAAAEQLGKVNDGLTVQQRVIPGVRGGMAHLTDASLALTDQQAKLNDAVTQQNRFLATLQDQYGITRQEAVALARAAGVQVDKNGQLVQGFKDSVTEADAFANANLKAQRPVMGLADAVTYLTDQMNKNVVAVLTLQGDEVAWRLALQAANKQLASNSAGLKGNSANALANKQSVIAATNAAVSFADDQLKLHGNLKLASQEIQSQIDWLQKHGDKTKFAREEIRALRLEEAKIKAQIGTNIIVHGSGSWTVLPTGKHIPTGAGGMAAGGRVPGFGGGDRWPALLEGGEAVVPKHLTPAIAPFLKAHGVPGFAAGGVMGSYGNGVTGLTGWLATENAATVKAVQQATASAIFAALRSPAGGFGGGPAGGDAAANMAIARRMFPWPASMWQAFFSLEMREAGFNRFATNPTSGAYGIPQALPPTKMPFAAQAAGGSNAAAQLAWMFSYIAGRYGNPVAAWGHELSAGWYDQGGWLMPGLSRALNTTGRPERVTSPGGEDAMLGRLDMIAGLLGELIGAVDDNARTTAAGVSRAFGGASRAAMHGALYSAR